jgi:hypothetical protein
LIDLDLIWIQQGTWERVSVGQLFKQRPMPHASGIIYETLVKNHFFQVVHYIKHSVQIHLPHVMLKSKRDENFVNLI